MNAVTPSHVNNVQEDVQLLPTRYAPWCSGHLIHGPCQVNKFGTARYFNGALHGYLVRHPYAYAQQLWIAEYE